jgi:hypothetical protein
LQPSEASLRVLYQRMDHTYFSNLTESDILNQFKRRSSSCASEKPSGDS